MARMTEIVWRLSRRKDKAWRGCEATLPDTTANAAAVTWLVASSIADRNVAAVGLGLTILEFLVMQECIIRKYYCILFSSNISFQSIPWTVQ